MEWIAIFDADFFYLAKVDSSAEERKARISQRGDGIPRTDKWREIIPPSFWVSAFV